jgi:hypothetical protein
MSLKYTSSNDRKIDESFELLPKQVQDGICASGLSMHSYLTMYVDDGSVIQGESFNEWLVYHFRSPENAVTGYTAIPDDVVGAIEALTGAPREGSVPESELATLGMAVLKVVS